MDKWRFPQSVQKLPPYSAISFVCIAESLKSSSSDPSISRAINISKSDAMPSSFEKEVKQMSPFRLLRLQRSLHTNVFVVEGVASLYARTS